MRNAGAAILLIGGTSEIGLAIVRKLTANDLGSVVLAGRHPAELERAAEHLTCRGNQVTTAGYDSLDPAGTVDQLLSGAQATLGRLDIVIVAIGMLQAPVDGAGSRPEGRDDGDSQPVSEPALADMLQANLVGPGVAANQAAAYLCRQGHGRLVVLTSASAVRPRAQILAYSLAKQALDGLVRGLDRRTRPYGVRCLVVRPGQVRTRMSAAVAPVPLMSEADDVGARVRRALTRSSSIVWVPALIGPVTTALRVLPGWALPKDLR